MMKLEKLLPGGAIITRPDVYEYFLNNYQLIAIDLSKQKELDADPCTIQQIEFVGNLPNAANVFFVLEQSLETTLDFYKETAKVA